MPARIDRDDLIAALQTLADELGRPPTRDEMDAHGDYSATPYYRAFGSWPAALDAAGLEVQYRQDISDDTLIAELQRLADTLGYVPRQADMAAAGRFDPATYRRRFGSWLDARAAAGLTDTKVQQGQRIPDEELMVALHMLARELGRPPTQSDMDERGLYSSDAYYRAFGSWSAALEAAGLALS